MTSPTSGDCRRTAVPEQRRCARRRAADRSVLSRQPRDRRFASRSRDSVSSPLAGGGDVRAAGPSAGGGGVPLGAAAFDATPGAAAFDVVGGGGGGAGPGPVPGGAGFRRAPGRPAGPPRG